MSCPNLGECLNTVLNMLAESVLCMQFIREYFTTDSLDEFLENAGGQLANLCGRRHHENCESGDNFKTNTHL